LAIVDDTTSVYDCAGHVSGILANVDLVVSGSVIALECRLLGEHFVPDARIHGMLPYWAQIF